MPNPNLPNQVFVGTDWGLYYTDNINDAVPTWHRFEGLPHVMVWEFVVDRGFTTLAAFTRARGAWVWPLPNSQLGASDVSVAASGPATANAGDTVSYTITVNAGSPTSAANVVVDDPAPAGLTFVSNSGDCVTAFPCQFATINIGETKTITATFKISPDFGSSTLSNTATVSSAGTDLNSANNTALVDTTVSVSADVSVTETVPDSVDPGASFTFTTTVTNNGTSTASDVSVGNTLPAGLGFVANSGDCGGAFPCAFDSLEPGVTKTITTTVCVSSPYTGSDPFALAANVTASSPDSQTSNNSFLANVAIDADFLFANGFDSCP
jgi:uncharacterized repeat protein (TIGR01451 family)